MIKFTPPMNTWAVIKTGGKQYKVAEGDTVVVEKLDEEGGKPVSFSQVLAVGGDRSVIGNPLVPNAQVKGKILQNFKGDKIRIVKFRPKSKYLRQTGHRQKFTKVLIEKIQI